MNTRMMCGLPIRAKNELPKRGTFADAWSRADRVFGWLTEEEGETLFNAAMQTPTNGLIVEVGSFMGRSLTLLAESGRRIISVDPLQPMHSVAKMRITDDTAHALQSVADSYANVTWLRRSSSDVVCPPRIDLLYIDACHKYPSPLDDFMAFRPGLVGGQSLVAFHDYGREFGVTKSVDELESKNIIKRIALGGTLFVGEVL